MPRGPRNAGGNVVYHVLNRGNERRTLFENEADFDAFIRVLVQTLDAVPMRLLAYCLMSNHWHLVVWPRADGDLGRFMQRLTVTHVTRWRAHRKSVGLGHLYQGAYKSFPVQDDAHFLAVCRYVERNPLRANLVEPRRTADWRWSSLAQRLGVSAAAAADAVKPALHEWPVDRLAGWTGIVNRPQGVAELEAIHTSLRRGWPFGDDVWVRRTCNRLGLPSTLRPRGRPRKTPK